MKGVLLNEFLVLKMEVSMENILMLLFGVRFGFRLLSCSLICAQLPLELRFIIELLWGRNFKMLKEGLTVDRRNDSDDRIEHSMLRNCTGDTLGADAEACLF